MGQKQSQAVAADDKKRSSSSNHQKQVQLPSGQVTTQPRRVSFNEADTNVF